uniref:NAD(+) ADP-ribosyltransferase n=1 Tax=Oncorhynchus tshawytscha TaxID=74940 RepID=A0AAZ3S2K1_ONCTS
MLSLVDIVRGTNSYYKLQLLEDDVQKRDEKAVKRPTASAGTKSLLAKPVQELIRTIFDVESMKKAMIDFQKMSLGKLSKRQIQSAYALLSEVQQAVSDSSSEPLHPHTSQLGHEETTTAQHPGLHSAKVQMLDNLLDIGMTYSMLRGAKDNNRDINYEILKTKIEVVDKTT